MPLMNAKQQYRIRWLHGWDPEVQVLVRAGRKGMQQTKALRQGSVLSQESRSATRQRLPIRRTASWEAVRHGYTGFGDVMSLHFESLYVSICLHVGIGFVHSFCRPCWRGRPVAKWGTNTAYAYPHIYMCVLIVFASCAYASSAQTVSCNRHRHVTGEMGSAGSQSQGSWVFY